MSDSEQNSVNNLDKDWNKQQNYAKSRLVGQLGMMLTNLTPAALSNSLTYSLVNYTWSEEEQAQIKKIVPVLGSIHELRSQLESLSMPLINTYWKPNSSQPTSMQGATTTDAGAVPTNKPE